jgi:FkbH-like protein
VALSKNDPQLVASALNAGKFLLSGTDFVGVWANYESKSKNMQEISSTLNIGLSDFVFIDDNPVELAEVGAQFNEVECLKFPDEESGMISFFKILQEHFSADLITEEDERRTEFYRNKSVKPIKRDLDEFLRELSMELTVNDRTLCCRERVLQLINKTNQFNLNGKRWQESEIQREIDNGARLFGASLSDRDGQHGEILAILISSNNLIQAFVMSCRVFQRKIENAFILQMLKIYSGNLLLNARRTERNEPFFNFLLQHAREEDNHFVISHDDFVSRNNRAAELFKIHFNQ